jgi:K+-transporting ATPase c subunit
VQQGWLWEEELKQSLVVTGLAQVLFPGRANGSIIVHHRQPVDSELAGQPFDDPKYFWGRLSATSPAPYTAFNLGELRVNVLAVNLALDQR